MQYEALKKRWKVLDDTVAMTKDDLYTSPAYMVDSDEESEDSSPSLHREDSHLSQVEGRCSEGGEGEGREEDRGRGEGKGRGGG